MIDIANQVTQQNAHKTAACEPYIAAIVGPYSKKLPTCQSSMTWFYVNHESGRIPSEDENPLQAGCTPMQLQVCTHTQPSHGYRFGYHESCLQNLGLYPYAQIDTAACMLVCGLDISISADRRAGFW